MSVGEWPDLSWQIEKDQGAEGRLLKVTEDEVAPTIFGSSLVPTKGRKPGSFFGADSTVLMFVNSRTLYH